MSIITSKAEIKPVVAHALSVYWQSGMDEFIHTIHKTILEKKVKYPILEYVAGELYQSLPASAQIDATNRIIALKENGSDVIAGKILQLRLPAHYDESIAVAVMYIIAGSNWLSCDTVGERVLGHALLTVPVKTIIHLKQLAQHQDKWVIRAVGVAVHYAVKKGLKKQFAEEMFCVLQLLANTTDFHTKKGIGWAAKTTAKFHPDIIEKYKEAIDDNPDVKQWFRSKIKIGLGRSFKYAHRYTS